MKRLALIALCIAAPQAALAAPITWEAFGRVDEIQRFPHLEPGPLPPPIGTSWSLRVSFDPDLRVRTPNAPEGSLCSMTSVSGAFTLGGVDYSIGSSYVFTNAMLPPTNCTNPEVGTIDFFMFLSADPGADEWQLLGSHFLLAIYSDLIHQDGTIPTVPVFDRPGILVFRNDAFDFAGDFSPSVVEQPTPVPEPATTVLVGIGLAWIGRQRWQTARSRVRR